MPTQGPVMQYLQFWQTGRPVFLRDLNSQDLYLTPPLRAGLDRLLILCQQRQALLLVTGLSGTGKSALLKWLYETLAVATHEVLLTSLVRGEVAMGWLVGRLAAFMGIAPRPDATLDVPQAIRAVAGALDELTLERRQLLVIVDAAHLLETPSAYGEITALLNLQALAGSCLSFLLAGDLRLVQQLQAVPELAGRLTLSLEVKPLTLSETAAYLAHRLGIAGIEAAFASDAAELIHALTGGILARINNLAENCLIEAAASGDQELKRGTVQAASEHIYGRGGRFVQDLSGQRITTPATAPTSAAADKANAVAGHETPAVPAATAATTAIPPPLSGKVAAEADGAGIKLTSLFKSEPDRKRS